MIDGFVHGRSIPAPHRLADPPVPEGPVRDEADPLGPLVEASTPRAEDGADDNQDAFVVAPTRSGGLMLLVCDGMGGMGRGAEASRLATTELGRALADGGDHDTLAEALLATDMTLRRTLVDPGPGRPGCTAVAVLVHQDQAFVGWAGDARCLHIRGSEVQHHTVDHKLVEELVASGAMSRNEARHGRMGHVVTRCLGGRRSGESGHPPETLESPWALQPGDALVLCSDGLSDVLDDEAIAACIAGCSATQAADALVQAATQAGTQDDTTVVVYRHPVAPAVDALTRSGTTARPDPLLEIADEPDDHATWPPQPPTVQDPAQVDVRRRRRSQISTLYIAGAVLCLVVAAALTVAYVGGWL